MPKGRQQPTVGPRDDDRELILINILGASRLMEIAAALAVSSQSASVSLQTFDEKAWEGSN